MYLDEVREDDKQISEAWKDGSDGILTFVSPYWSFIYVLSMTSSKIGLFSAIVAAFIIEFYKQLSPDSGNQTVALLGQISQQLVNLPNGTYSITANQPSPPSASMIWANAMWLISLVSSLASALIATLLQQWARRYVETPNVPSKPNHRARVRSYLFLGTEIYQMRFVSQLAFSLLHFSVYLFLSGLVMVFHGINKHVAIAVEVAVGVFGLAYITLSILPCLDVQCPYRTPMSPLLWYPTHIILSFSAVCLRWLMELLRGCLVDPSLTALDIVGHRIFTGWLESRERTIRTHWRYVTEGLGKSIINGAINAQGDGDRKIVTGLFNRLALGDENKLRKLAASIPRDKILDLLSPIESGKFVLREPLRILLQSYVAGTHGPEEEVRKHSLWVCLDVIHYIANLPGVPDLDYVLTNFANIGLMRALWDDGDTAIRVASRSICALLARQVIRQEWLTEQQIHWLQDATGSTAVYGADTDTRNHMNFKSFVYGVLSDQMGDLPTEDAVSFKNTLAILLDVENDADFDTNFQSRLSEEVDRIHQDDPEHSDDVVYKLRTMFHLPIPFPHS